ncbi:UNVERIFIED_CONTAM: hypothetical protein FKN15_047878 [Acipenser sinensis]
MQQQIIRETFHLVSKRDDNVCNFLEGGSLIGGSDYKLIYRHYATLYFVFCVDSCESELGILDLIQVTVHVYHSACYHPGGHASHDKCLIGGSDYKLIYRHYATLYFVFCVDSCESELGILDLIQVHYILQQVVMGGMVLETNMNEIVAQVENQNRLEKSENMNLPEIPRNINIGDINIKVPNLSPFV